MTAVAVLLGAVVLLLSVLVVGLLRSHAEILRALHDLGVNPTEAPRAARSPRAEERDHENGTADAADLNGRVPGGGRATVAVTGVDHSTLLAFLSSGCETCQEFWETLRTESPRLPGRDTRVVIVTQDAESESEAAVLDLAPDGVTTIMSSAAWDAYGVPVSPYFVLVDGAAGRVAGEGTGTSWRQLANLLDRATADADLRRRTTAVRANGAARASAVDAELLAAGIEPGDPSLYPPDRAAPGPT